MTTVFLQDKNRLLFILTMLIFAILCSFGIWQLKRLNEKTILIESIKSVINSDPINIIHEPLDDLRLYQKILMTGHFTDDHVFLYGRKSATIEKDGYYVLSTFIQDGSNKKILVSRGWAPLWLKNKIESGEVALDTNNTSITAITRAGEASSFLVPKNDIKRKIWFNIDLILAQKELGIDVTNFYLMQIDNSALSSGMKANNQANLVHIRNDHLEYAITWFSLAICLIVIYVLRVKKQTIVN